jgi:predicted DNA-binding transcriptional regulator AlpA
MAINSDSNELPKPVKLSANITRWDNAEVEKSIEG